MALADFPGGILIPHPQWIAGQAFRIITLDADGEFAACIFPVPKSGNIRKIGIRAGTIAQMTNSLKVGLYTVDDTNGFPDDPLSAYGSMVAATDTPAANTFTWYTLGTDAAATVGNNIAMVAEFDNFAASDDIDLNLGVTRENSQPNFPYVTAKLGGSWADQLYPPNLAIEYDDGSIEWIAGCTPFSGSTEQTWNSTSNPDRRGIRFQVPFKCRMVGVYVLGRLDQNFGVVFYDTDGTSVLETITHDGSIRQGSSAIFTAPLVAKKVLTINTNYRLVVLPTTASSIRMYKQDVTDDGANKTIDALPMGVKFHATTADGVPSIEGDWTNIDTSLYPMGIIVDQLDDGAGGGGGGAPGNMTGGLQ